MKIALFLFPVVTASLLTGCAATRTLSDVGLGAGGAALANEVSKGDPVAIAAGAAGGVIVSEALHYVAKTQSERAYANGYDKGRSDAVKQQYWLYVAQQRARNSDGHIRLYEVQLPEQTIEGVTFKPTTKFLRIEE